jgi:subtilase-type serine protease
MGCFKLTAVAFAVMSLFSVRAQAIDTEILKDSNGVPIIEMRFYSPGDGNYYEYDNGQPYGSSWVLSQTQKDQMIAGLNYWANIIQVKPGKSPAIINVGTISVSGANAISPTVKGLPIAPSQVGAALQNLDAGPLKYDAHGFINIGTLAFGTDPYIPSQLPMVSSGEADLSVVILHEFAHALGIGSTVIDARLQPGHTPYFDSTLSTWSAGLRDDNGKAAQAGQAIWCNGCNNPASADVFDVSLDKGYFTGKHVDEVLAGAMRGIPVVISDEFGSVDT